MTPPKTFFQINCIFLGNQIQFDRIGGCCWEFIFHDLSYGTYHIRRLLHCIEKCSENCKKYSRKNRDRYWATRYFLSLQVNHYFSIERLKFPLHVLLLFSVFYVFYEQYINVWSDAMFSLGLSLGTIFIVSFILTGCDIISALVILIIVTLILINMGGLLWMWSITLNAISLVNLVVVSQFSLFDELQNYEILIISEHRNWSRICFAHCEMFQFNAWHEYWTRKWITYSGRQQRTFWHYIDEIFWNFSLGFSEITSKNFYWLWRFSISYRFYRL